MFLMAALPISCIGYVGYSAWSMFTKPVAQAVLALESDPQVIEKLGKPLKRGSAVGVNNYNNNNGNGGADIDFNVSGSQGSAHVSGRMVLTAGTWRPDGLQVKFSDGTQVSIGE
jgi:hypothetical protein